MTPARESPALRARVGEGAVWGGVILALLAVPLAMAPALYDDFTLVKQSVMLGAGALILFGLAIEGRLLPANRWLQAALGALLVVLVVAWATGMDPRGSLLGYYQYRQGLLTLLAYLLVFLGSFRPGSQPAARRLLFAGYFAAVGVLLYALVQASGNDPIAWWLDTSDRAISSIGNANELAAYAVVAAGLLLAFRRPRPLAVAAFLAGVSFVVIVSGSRSGLLAFSVELAVLCVAPLLPRLAPGRRVALSLAPVVGTAAGIAIAFSVGALVPVAERAGSLARQQDPSGSTRTALWSGTLRAIEASPFTGYGPDGLYLAFPQHRQAGLDGAFRDYDLVAQSSHNFVLDTAANTGLLGLGALAACGAILIAGIWRAGRQLDYEAAVFVAAAAGYGVMVLLNPLSLAAHSTFLVLAGFVAGRRLPAWAPRPSRFQARWSPILAAPAAASLMTVALLLPIADWRADAAWIAYRDGDFARAASLYGDAAGLMPIERRYRRAEAEAALAAAVRGDAAALARAEAAYRRFDARFGFSSNEAIGFVATLIGRKAAPAEVLPAVDRVVRLSPNSPSIRSYCAKLRRAAHTGGALRYSARDKWVYVEPAAAPLSGTPPGP